MRIPTILSGANVRTGPAASPSKAFIGPGAAPQISFAGAEDQAQVGRAISGGLSDVAGDIQQRSAQYAQKAKERQDFNNHMWSESQFIGAQRDWAQWVDDVQKNGSEDVVDQFKAKFQDYQANLLKSAPNENAAMRLKLKMDDLGTQVFQSSMKIEAHNRSQNTVNTFTQMLSDTADLVSKDPEVYAIPQLQLVQNLDYAKKQGRITDDVYQRLKEQAQNISVIAAEGVVAKNPDYAEQIMSGATGIEWTRRKAVMGEIERARNTNDSLFRYQQQETFKSHLDSIMETGAGATNFDMTSYASSFPKEHQAAAIAEAKDKIDIAQNLYVGKSSLLGKSPVEVSTILQSFRPESGDPKFADKEQVYSKMAEFADNQVKLFGKDPFSYSRQDPVVDHAWKLVEQLPKDAKPELVQHLTQQALEASIGFQKKSGIPEGRLSVMSESAAGQYAQIINKGDVKQVQDSFIRLQQTYGKYYAQAFRDMVRLPEGQRIDAATQVVALHLGQPFLADFIGAVRTPESDMKIDVKDRQQIRDRLMTTPDFMAFRGAMLSANPGAASMVDDFNTAIDKYATSMYIRGKAKNPSDAVKQATDLVIGSAYGFTTVDGTPVAVKRQQGPSSFNDDDIQLIGQALGSFQKSIPQERVDQSRFAFPANVSDELKASSVRQTLKVDTFWVTNALNDGATLYMNGAEGSTAPVKWKDGRPIEAKFTQALSYGRGVVRRDKETSRPWWASGLVPTLYDK